MIITKCENGIYGFIILSATIIFSVITTFFLDVPIERTLKYCSYKNNNNNNNNQKTTTTTTSSDRMNPLNDIELVLKIWLVKGFTELAHEPLNEVGSGCGYTWHRKGIGTVRHHIHYSLVWRYLVHHTRTHAHTYTL